VTAVPNGGGGYGMANNRSQSMENNNQNQNVNTEATVQPPQGVYIVSSTYQDREDYLRDEYIGGGSSWADGGGGWLEGDSFDGSQTWDGSVSWLASPWPEAVPWGTLWVTNNGQFYAYSYRPASLSFHYANEKVNEKDPVTGSSFSESAQGALEFATGGPLGSTAVRLYQFSGSVTIHHSPQPPDNDEVPWSIPPDDETVADGRVSLGNVGNLDANGNTYAQLADNTRVMVTPSVKGQDDYSTPPPTSAEVTLGWIDLACSPPLDASRTNIGIGESVYCYISGALSANWSVTGGGSISPTNGNNATFTAPKTPGTSTVHAKIGGKELTQDFKVIAPSSITVVGLTNSPLGTEVTNGTTMGAQTIYSTIIGPTNVSFQYTQFREFIPPVSVTWPNGTNTTFKINSTTTPFSLSCGGSQPDEIMISPQLISNLFNGTNYVDFSFTSTWTDQYQDNSGNWVDYYTLNAKYEFRASDKKCRITYLGVPGSWQGPY
jgi:hypothetical protein